MNEHKGTWIDWHLKLWGESEDPALAKLLPMPTEEDDADHDITATTTLSATTTTLPPDPAATQSEPPIVTPSDHPDRPSKVKPSTTLADGSVATDTGTAVDEKPAAETSSSSWLPGFLPTFGVSPATQAWIWGSIALIVIFCSGLGVYLWIARRRRLRNSPRDGYEFELLDEEEAEGLNGGEKGARGGKKGRKTRGGELYDAFAGGSDDEADFEADEYRDRSADREDGQN
jgi:kexin